MLLKDYLYEITKIVNPSKMYRCDALLVDNDAVIAKYVLIVRMRKVAEVTDCQELRSCQCQARLTSLVPGRGDWDVVIDMAEFTTEDSLMADPTLVSDLFYGPITKRFTGNNGTKWIATDPVVTHKGRMIQNFTTNAKVIEDDGLVVIY